jgi:UDP-glucose 4-epimerase
MPSQSPNNVLVTGGAGYIGSHAVLALLEAGRRVTVIDDLSTGFRSAVAAEAHFCQGSIADRRLLAQLIGDRKIGAIMHFAGSIIVPESVVDPLKYYRNNTVNAAGLIECAVAAGVRHFVFSSSAAVYGIPDAIPITEESATRPINPYGTSKLMTEMMLRDVAAAHPLNFCALRYFNVAGADPDGRAGQSTAAATHLIKVAVEAAVGKRVEVAIFGNDYATRDGTGVRDYIHVTDLARAHVAALAKLAAEPARSLTLNCGYGCGHSVLEVLDAVERVVGTRLARRVEPRRTGDPPILVADSRRIVATLDWQPRYADLDTIVSHALAWERRLLTRPSV